MGASCNTSYVPSLLTQHRLSLARAAYARKKVYLLDDPLAALGAIVCGGFFDGDVCERIGLFSSLHSPDATVAQHVIQECIVGLLGSTTRLLATHNAAALQQVPSMSA